jgi:hypothetical protein
VHTFYGPLFQHSYPVLTKPRMGTPLMCILFMAPCSNTRTLFWPNQGWELL